MAIVTSQTLSFESSSIHRDASFSSYLNDDERIIALRLSESNQNINTILSNSHEPIYTAQTKIEDREIGVFSAEKYFKGDMDDDGNPKIRDKSSKRYQDEKDVLVNIDPVKPKVQPAGTPSVRSSSSYNSQTALLPTNHQSRKMKKAYCKSFFSSLSCSCSCNNKNSVVIDDHVEESKEQSKTIIEQPKKAGESAQKNKIQSKKWADQETMRCKNFDEMGVGMSREECFSFPVLNPKKESLAVKLQSPEGEDNASRKSLEVFGSPIADHGNKSLSFERKGSMLTWDLVNPRMDETGIPKNHNVMNDDSESDASSELFEIESFSTKTNSFLGRQTSDGASSCVTPTTCYAPSEASIEWSVVTASAAEFPIMSYSEDFKTAVNTRNQNRMTMIAKNAPGKELHKQRPNILSGCKSQKAVRVAGDAYKVTEKAIPVSEGRHRLDPCKPVAKFQAETKLTGFGTRHGHNTFNTRLGSPANGSHLLYIQ